MVSHPTPKPHKIVLKTGDYVNLAPICVLFAQKQERRSCDVQKWSGEKIKKKIQARADLWAVFFLRLQVWTKPTADHSHVVHNELI